MDVYLQSTTLSFLDAVVLQAQREVLWLRATQQQVTQAVVAQDKCEQTNKGQPKLVRVEVEVVKNVIASFKPAILGACLADAAPRVTTVGEIIDCQSHIGPVQMGKVLDPGKPSWNCILCAGTNRRIALVSERTESTVLRTQWHFPVSTTSS